MQPLVDVNIAVYNQAPYLRQTLDSVLAQQANFPFRLLIGDDCSTDGSVDILKEYEKKYPDQVNVIFQPRNLGLNAAERNGIVLLKKSTAKYIALLDGDDYWIDPYKLQKQVDFLQANSQYIICFTRGLVNNAFLGSTKVSSDNSNGRELNIDDFIKANDQLTASALFINNSDFLLPHWFANLPFGDWTLYLLLMYTYKMKAFCLSDVSVVYRIHDSGNHGSMHITNTKLIDAYKMHITFYNVIEKKLLGNAYKKAINISMSEKISIITNLCSKENEVLKGVKINLIYILKGLSLKAFFKNIIYLQKQYLKSIISKQ